MKQTVAMQILGASEYILSIALAVFVTITVILLAFIILLFASGKFRSLFFGGSNEKSDAHGADKPNSKRKSQVKQSVPIIKDVEALITESPKSEGTTEKQKSPPRKKRSDDPVPTVPIDFPFTPAKPISQRRNEPTYANTFEREPTAKKERTVTRTYDHVPTVFIPRTGTQPPVNQAATAAAQRRASAKKPAAKNEAEALVDATDSKTVKSDKKSAKSGSAKSGSAKSSGSAVAPKTKK